MKRYIPIINKKIITELFSIIEGKEFTFVEFFSELESSLAFMSKENRGALSDEDIIRNEFQCLCMSDYIIKINKDASFNIVKCKFAHSEVIETYINFLSDKGFILSTRMKLYIVLNHFIKVHKLDPDMHERITDKLKDIAENDLSSVEKALI